MINAKTRGGRGFNPHLRHMERPLVATGIFIVRDGKVLLVRFNDQKGEWSGKLTVPGGKVEFGESAKDCVRREAREEIGVEVEPLRLVNVNEARDVSWKDGSKKHFVFLNYQCRIISGEPKAGSDAAEILWVSPEEIRDELLNHPESIRDTLKKMGFLAGPGN